MERIAKLTKRTVDAAQPEASRYIVWDQELKGFGLRVEPTGAKSFLVRYRAGVGRAAPQRQIKIGSYGVFTVDQARTRAREMLAAAAGGKDPGRERAEQKAALSVRELGEMFMADHVAVKRKPSTYRAYDLLLKNHIYPSLGTMKAAAVSRADVAALHRRMKAKPYQANRAVVVLGSIYAFAENAGIVPEGLNPARKVELFKESARERFLNMEELGRLGEAIAQAESVGVHVVVNGKTTTRRISPYAAAAIRLLLLTGARLREITNLEWDFVDLERGRLQLPDSKTGAKVIHLSAPAAKVLADMPREPGNPFVIVGQKEGRNIVALHTAWNAVRDAAGLKNIRIHDLRHTFASIGAGAGLGLPIVGKLLGHAQASTTNRYAHLADDPLRRGNDMIARQIASAMGILKGETEQSGEIVPIRQKLEK